MKPRLIEPSSYELRSDILKAGVYTGDDIGEYYMG